MSLRLLSGRRPTRLIMPVIGALAALGVTPLQVTFVSLAGNLAAAALVGGGWLALGGAVMLLASALDLLDGMLARATGRVSALGGLLDSTFDRVAEVAVLFGVLVHVSAAGERELVLLTFAAAAGSLLVSYVRARAEAAGVALTAGLFTRPERVAVLAAALVTGWLRAGLWVLAVATLLTALQRLLLAARALRQSGR